MVVHYQLIFACGNSKVLKIPFLSR